MIPARGGSKGIPGKNLADAGGRPLIAWTIEAALGAQRVDRTVVSTDDAAIADAARSLGADVLERPSALATDDAPMLGVVRHAVDELAPDVVVLLQPTSPLRRSEHVDAATALLEETGADCVVSVVAVPHRYRPEALMALEDGRLTALGASRSRDEKAPVVARNGPAVLALRAATFGEDFYEGDVRAYEMAERDSLDIDEPWDLELAGLVLRSRA